MALAFEEELIALGIKGRAASRRPTAAWKDWRGFNCAN